MNKTLVINLGQGNLDRGFPSVTVQILEDLRIKQKAICSLSSASNLVKLYQEFHHGYNLISQHFSLRLSQGENGDDINISENENDGFEIEEAGKTNFSDLDLSISARRLEEALNEWLSSSPSLNQILTIFPTNDLSLVVVEIPQTNQSEIIPCLPWHSWNFIKNSPQTEIAFHLQNNGETLVKVEEGIRILIIIGNTEGLNVEKEREYLQQTFSNAKIQFEENIGRQRLFERIQEGWDIIVSLGHSRTRSGQGIIYLFNEQGEGYEVTIKDLENAFKVAINKGLKLAIFNSCDGVGFGLELAKLNIPYTIFMQEPVPNKVAEEFLKYFLDAFANQLLPLHLAVRKARENLQSLDGNFPFASWLPVLVQNPIAPPIVWEQFMDVSWFWQQLKQKANSRNNSRNNWLKFTSVGEEDLGLVVPPPPKRNNTSIQSHIYANLPYLIKINLVHPGCYLLLLNRGLSTSYLICPSAAFARNNQLNGGLMLLPQDNSMMDSQGFEFDTVGKEEFIAIVLDKPPLHLDWLTVDDYNPAPVWEKRELQQLMELISHDNAAIFYQEFEVKAKEINSII